MTTENQRIKFQVSVEGSLFQHGCSEKIHAIYADKLPDFTDGQAVIQRSDNTHYLAEPNI